MSQQRYAVNELRLSPFEEEFCHRYVANNGNGTAAILALRSHLARNSAATLANKLMKKTEICARIEQIRSEMMAKIDLDSERWMEELARLCVFDVRQIATWDNAGHCHIKASDQIDDNTAAAVKKLKNTIKRIPQGKDKEPIIEETIELEFWSKEKALELYGRVLGKFIDKARKEERPDLGKQLELAQQRLDAHRKKQGLEIVRL